MAQGISELAPSGEKRGKIQTTILGSITPAVTQRARKARLSAFFHQHNVRYAHIVQARIQAIQAAIPLTEDVAVIESNRLLVEVLVAQLRVLLQAVERSEQQIADLAPTLPNYALFDSLPGTGPTFAPRLLAAFREQRERYASADEIQKYAGLAPVTERSGNKSWVHWRLQCPKFPRQTFVEWAALSIPHCYWAKAYYE